MRKLFLAAFLAIVAYAASAAWRPSDSAASALAEAIRARAAAAEALR